MVAQEDVLRLVREGYSYQEAAARLGTSPGLAYLAATGVPTDSSDGLSPEDRRREGLVDDAQQLSNPPTDLPDRSVHVRRFLAARAGRDHQMQQAAARRKASAP